MTGTLGRIWLAARVVTFSVLYAGTFLGLVPWWLSGIGRFDMGWARWLGLAPLCLGALVVAACVAGFAVRGQGTAAPFDPPRQLVTGWLHGRVRNPMYLGGTLVLLGEALVWQSLAVLGYAVCTWTVWHLLVVGYEEPALRQRFGAGYHEYQRRTRRWLPRLRAPV